ncbi:putative WW domain protein [Thermoascus aurantiacus ATCC 26904]
MSFAPPPGPPPPLVPEGWKAQFDDRFFVNLSTGVSQWEPPQRPAHQDEASHAAPPSEPPPSYEQSGPANPAAAAAAGDKKTTLGSNNPYNQPGAGGSSLEDDARLAAQLQAEENARAAGRSPAGASADYYNQGPAQTPPPGVQGSMLEPQQQRSKSGGFLSKLLGKASGKHSSGYGNPSPQYGGYPPPQGGYGGYPHQQPGYGGYPGGGYGPGGGYPPQGGFYPPQGYGAPPRRHGGGLGTAGAAALGIGGGLLGGALLANALDNDYEDGYQAGFEDGADFGGDF